MSSGSNQTNNLFHFLSRGINSSSGLIKQITCLLLVSFANLGAKSAAYYLVEALGNQQISQKTGRLYSFTRLIFHQRSRQVLWETFYKDRNAELGKQLRISNRPTSQKNQNTYIFSLLYLNKAKKLPTLNKANAEVFAFFSADKEQIVRKNALEHLKAVRTQAVLNIICEFWYKNRDIALEEIITTRDIRPKLTPLKNTLVDLMRQDLNHSYIKSADNLQTLIHILNKEDPRFQKLADFLLRNLDTPKAINQFCALWYENRDPQLEGILTDSQYLASRPEDLALITRLKLNKNLNRIKITPSKVEILIACLEDQAHDIQINAKDLLISLQEEENQKAFLEHCIQNGTNKLAPIINQIRFQTKLQDLLAVTYFMAENWQKYEAIDFTQQYLSTYFDTADDETRKKIIEKIQSAGKPQYTSILLAKKGKKETFSYDEAVSSIELFTRYKKWEDLWILCQNTYLDLSLKAFSILNDQNWQPASPNEAQLFFELRQLEINAEQFSTESVLKEIPFAIPISILRFKGRINDVDFAPNQNILAMATNQRAVLLWNYKKGQAEKLIRGFNHSVGLLNYDNRDNLYIGEKTNSKDYCDIWRWQNDSLSLIGFHQGSITSILPYQDNMLITTGKDKRIVSWDVDKKEQLKENKLGWWPRAALYQPDHHFLSLFNTFRLDFHVPNLTIENFTFVMSNPKVRTGVIREALVNHAGELLIGQNNGQIILHNYDHQVNRFKEVLLQELPSNLIGLASTASKQDYMAIAKSGEMIQFDENTRLQTLQNPIEANFTSFQISPDKTLFATGTNAAKTILWDLRPSSIRTFINDPLSKINNHQWAVLKFTQKNAAMSKQCRNILHYCNRILENRYRFDIELANIEQLSPGEFDIEIE